MIREGQFIHPEAWSTVLTEFKRLHDKFPELDGTEKWAMARDYAWTVALADTFIFKALTGLSNE